MRKDCSLALLLLLLACSLLDGQFLPDGVSKHPKLLEASDAESAIHNEYICVLNLQGGPKTEDFSELEALIAKAEEDGIVVMHVYRFGIQGFSITNVTDAGMKSLLDQPEVKFCEQNQLDTAHTGRQVNPLSWGLDRIDQKKPALDRTYEFGGNYGTGACVYIIDTGVSSSHEDWGSRSIECVYDVSLSNCNDGHGHGTHVAGTACGVISGVAKNANCMAAKVLGDSGNGTKSITMKGMQEVAMHARRNFKGTCVANLSLGGSKSQAQNDLLNELSKDMLFVVSAGNSNTDSCLGSPSSAEEALTVGATEINFSSGKDSRAAFSNWGTCVDVFAPGRHIISASAASGGYMSKSGTSMAAPHVTGAVALLLGWKSKLSVKKVKRLILKYARQGKIENLDLLPKPTPNLIMLTRKIIKKGDKCANEGGFCINDSGCCNSTCRTKRCSED